MPRPTVILYLPGIETQGEGNIDEWAFRAVRWTNLRTPHRAYPYTYHVSAIGRDLEQATHVHNVCELIGEFRRDYPGCRIVVVAHSNGADLAVRATWACPVDVLHLIAAATDGDYRVNRFNDAVAAGRVGRVVWYVSAGDRAMRVARRTQSWWYRALTLGLAPRYGSAGSDGPSHMTPAAAAVTTTVRDDSLDHSDYFDAAHFEATMQGVTGWEDLPTFQEAV